MPTPPPNKFATLDTSSYTTPTDLANALHTAYETYKTTFTVYPNQFSFRGQIAIFGNY